MSSSALTGRREELGSEVMEALMGACCQPLARPEQTPEAFLRRYRLMAIDGTLFNTPDTPSNEKEYGRESQSVWERGLSAGALRALGRVWDETPVVGLKISRSDESEGHGSHLLLRLVSRAMLVLVDGGIISAGVVQAVRDRRAHVLASLPWGMWEKGKRIRLTDGARTGAT